MVIVSSPGDPIVTKSIQNKCFQIELDLLRTLPNNKHYDSPNADGIPKLRRVLLAYSVHNPDVEYCQVSFIFAFNLLLEN